MAETAYSDLFDSKGFPVKGRPSFGITGGTFDSVTVTVPTTQLDTIGDRYALIPLPIGAEFHLVDGTGGDFDDTTTALDADLVIHTFDEQPDIVLTPDGTIFQDASTFRLFQARTIKVPYSPRGFARLDFLVNTPATTPQQAALTVMAWWGKQ